jgi:hypothetical protein
MKKVFYLLFVLLFISCSNTVNYHPSINFIGGNGLISEDVVLKPNQQFRVGINSFSKGNSNLYNFKVTRIFNNTSEIIVDSIIDNKNFNMIMTCPSAVSEGTERWTFSITCKDGYSSEVSFQIKTSLSDTTQINSTQSLIKEYVVLDLPNKISRDDILIYVSLFVLLVFGAIVYFIRKSKLTTKEYVLLKSNYLDDMKKELIDKIESQKSPRIEGNKGNFIVFVAVSIVIIVFLLFLLLGEIYF